MEHPLYDPLGLEIFVIEESFENIFSGLSGVYARLSYKESKRPDGLRSESDENFYRKRFSEISRLKNSYLPKDWEGKRNAVSEYSSELKEMIAKELTNYGTF